MNFTILVNASPLQPGAVTAYQFSKAVLEQGHRILRIFFYRDGVLNANVFITPPQDEFNVVKAWQSLADQHGVELVVCVAAALRRGVLDDGEARQQDKNQGNLASGFKITGLGQLIEGMINADRFIVFN